MLQQKEYDRFISFFPPSLNEEIKQQIKAQFSYKIVKKGDILFDQNSTEKKGYFLLQGSCVRYIITPLGDEKAIMFHTENFLPIVGNMLFENDKNLLTYSVKANENTEIIEMPFGIRDFTINDAEYNDFARTLALHYLAVQNQFQNHLVGLTSEDFLKWLLSNYGFLFNRFRSKDIASFMGVTPVWLSTLKAKLK